MDTLPRVKAVSAARAPWTLNVTWAHGGKDRVDFITAKELDVAAIPVMAGHLDVVHGVAVVGGGEAQAEIAALKLA